MTTTTTESKKQTWRDEIQKLIDRAQFDLADQREAFQACANRHGLTYAIEWKTDDLAKAEGSFRMFAAVHSLLKHGAAMESKDGDLARAILDQLDDLLKQALFEAKNGHRSTCPYKNAIEASKLSGFIGALTDTFAGGAHAIRKIISKACVIGG